MNDIESTTAPAVTVFRSPCTEPGDVQRFQSFPDDHKFLPEVRLLHALLYDFDANSELMVRAGKAMTTPGAAESGAFPRENLDGNDWSVMLQADDRFARWCEWDRLRPEDWVSLLRKKPHFADRLPESVETRFTGFDWALILEESPELESRCDWSKLEDFDWKLLLDEQPQFADRRPADGDR